MAIALVATGLVFASCNKNKETVKMATFEEFSVGEIGYTLYTADGLYNWTSGDFGFFTGVQYQGTYNYGYVVTNQTENTFEGYEDMYHSAPGGPVAGNNFCVAFQDTYNDKTALSIKYSGVMSVLPGAYVTNTAYAVSSMENGDAYAKKFANGDYFLLTFTGYLADVEIGKVEFYLADFRNGKSIIVKDWQYVDLTDLGLVDEVRCKLTSSDNGDYGMNTPAYFCIDNFGGKR